MKSTFLTFFAKSVAIENALLDPEAANALGATVPTRVTATRVNEEIILIVVLDCLCGLWFVFLDSVLFMETMGWHR